MKLYLTIFTLLILLVNTSGQTKADSLYLSGDIGVWLHYNTKGDDSYSVGGRYIPALNYTFNSNEKHYFTGEASAYLFSNTRTSDFSSYETLGEIDPYRVNVKYVNGNISFSIGLQEIMFGAAKMLRPLMWFDQIDPRDPMLISSGVYAIQGKYMFQNESRISLWALYGNKELKGWDWAASKSSIPEFGGRFQVPVNRGNVAFNYHYRMADFIQGSDTYALAEQKFGMDVKLDYTYGVWFEASWNNINNINSLYLFSNQLLATVGVDRTVGIGNGLYFVFEHMIVSYQKSFFSFDNITNMSAIEASYPITKQDDLSSILYYDWEYKRAYSFFDWQHNFTKLDAHIIAYWNAESTRLPNMKNIGQLYTGRGLQFMLVYNY